MSASSTAPAPARAQRLAEAKTKVEQAKREMYAAQRAYNKAQAEYENIMDEIGGPLVD